MHDLSRWYSYLVRASGTACISEGEMRHENTNEAVVVVVCTASGQ
jgi:hypothetical protein